MQLAADGVRYWYAGRRGAVLIATFRRIGIVASRGRGGGYGETRHISVFLRRSRLGFGIMCADENPFFPQIDVSPDPAGGYARRIRRKVANTHALQSSRKRAQN